MLTYIVLVLIIILIYYLTYWTFRHEDKPPEAQSGLFRERSDWRTHASTPDAGPRQGRKDRRGARSQRR